MVRISVLLFVALTACAGLGKRTGMDVRCTFDPTQDSIKKVGKGFCGSDSYRLTATGAPAKIETTRQGRRKSSASGALLAAHYFMITTFEGHCLDQSIMGYPKGYVEKQTAWRKEIRELVKKGKVVYSTCDESDNCTILYELHFKGLRKKFDACYR